MFTYEFNKKLYCGMCYRKLVPENEQKRAHQLDGNEFYHKFQDQVVQCAGCGVSIEYRNLYTTTEHSLGEHDEEED
jgi:RNase P subunit RPR2